MGDSNEVRCGQKAQVVLVSGFLGAGKTTLLQWMLSWPADLSGTVVMINEFGDAGIDASLLNSMGSDIVELSSGCICCTLSADFKQSLKRVWDRFHPQRILIEASGVADPSVIASLFSNPDIQNCMELGRIITVLDADFWEAREAFGPLFYNQLEVAHLILLNKVDLLDEDKIPDFLAQIQDNIPNSRVIPTVRCRIDPQVLWMHRGPDLSEAQTTRYLDSAASVSKSGAGAAAADGRQKKPTCHEHPLAHKNFVTFSFQDGRILKESCFYRFLDELPWRVFRVKGPVRFKDRTVLLNFAGGKYECLPWEDGVETHLVFIAWAIWAESVLEQLRTCAGSS